MLDGRYVFGDRPRDSFTVETKPNQVSIVRAGVDARGSSATSASSSSCRRARRRCVSASSARASESSR